MINRGVDYRLETTTVSVSNPRGGAGFMAGALRFSETFGIGAARNGGGPLAARNGGGRVHRVEMIEHGTGYQELGSTVQGLESIIAIDGDGIDLDLDGTPDSKMDPSKINLDFLGGVYIEQVFDLEVLTVPQQGATLSLTDANKTITILFTTVADSTNPLNIATESGTGTKSTTTIRDDIVDMIELHWPDRSNLFMGPQVEANATGGSVFTYSALSGRVSSSNPSAISVSPRSNMLFSGSGFTRATASIAPPAVIYGFSEILSGTTTVSTAGGRRVFDVQIDMESDDVYLFDFNTSRNQRVSEAPSVFQLTTCPVPLVLCPVIASQRSVQMVVMFTSVRMQPDRADLLFSTSNQNPSDTNTNRDVYYFDRKTTQLSAPSFASLTSVVNAMSGLSIGTGDSTTTTDVNGAITSITLTNVQDRFFFNTPEVEVAGTGSGAVVTAVLDQNISSPNYGKVTGLTVVNGGSGYVAGTTSYNLKQVFNVIGNGVPAQLRLSTNRQFDPATGLSIFVENTVSIRRDVNGNLLSGYGYVIAPNFRQLRNNSWSTITLNGQSLARLPLEPSNLSTSSVAFFSFTNDTNYDQVRITGGFIHSPIYIDLNVSAPLTGGNIASVELLVDGQSSDETTLNSPPYNFAWIPDEANDYSLSVAVTDDTGGRKVTSLGTYSIKEFYGSGISATFNGDANITIPSNGTFLLSVDASSEYGIKEVEFFINNVSVGKVFDQGLPTFIKLVDLAQFNFGEGSHQISMVATDYRGNQTGTFEAGLTNLSGRQNKTLLCLPFLPPSLKPVTAISYPPNGFSTTSTSTIRLEANASDPDGSLEGVQFYVNGLVQDAWSGILDFNGTVPADGQLLTIDDGTRKAPITFEFDDNQSLTGGGTANLVATQGNQLDDFNISGTYKGYEAKNYIIEIDSNATPNTFRWSKDGGVTFVNENVSITGAAQTLENGLSGTFTATIGHGIGDRWMIQASAVSVRVPIATGGTSLLVNARRTRDALREAIENQSNLGLLSFFTNDEASDDQLNLYHKMDQNLTGTASVTGTSLTTGGGTLYLFDNDFEPLKWYT
jgi:hypothetical protein